MKDTIISALGQSAASMAILSNNTYEDATIYAERIQDLDKLIKNEALRYPMGDLVKRLFQLPALQKSISSMFKWRTTCLSVASSL